jgi:hypothetical protein
MALFIWLLAGVTGQGNSIQKKMFIAALNTDFLNRVVFGF